MRIPNIDIRILTNLTTVNVEAYVTKYFVGYVIFSSHNDVEDCSSVNSYLVQVLRDDSHARRKTSSIGRCFIQLIKMFQQFP